MQNQNLIKKLRAGVFIGREELKKNNIDYQIRLEYYKTKNIQDEYGIEIVKTEYRKNFTKVENEIIAKITKEEEKINNIIYKLKENLVTPIELKDVINEMII